MTHIPPTILDVSRAVAQLGATVDDHGRRHPQEARQLVASNLAFQFARYLPLGGRKTVTARDVRFALMAHGADRGPTLDADARAIAALIRADFSDGRMSA